MKLKDLKHGKCYRTSRYFFIFDETSVSFPEDDDITNIYVRFMGEAIDFTWYADYPQVHVVSGAWMWLFEEIEEFDEKTLAVMIKLVTVATDNVLKVLNYGDRPKLREIFTWNNSLHIYTEKPTRDDGYGEFWLFDGNINENSMHLDCDLFPEVTYENSPVEVTLTIAISGTEVQDDDNTCPICGSSLDSEQCCPCCGYGRR